MRRLVPSVCRRSASFIYFLIGRSSTDERKTGTTPGFPFPRTGFALHVTVFYWRAIVPPSPRMCGRSAIPEASECCDSLAPRAGFEPATNRLTAGCSTAELPGNSSFRARNAYNKAGPALKAAKRRQSRCVRLGFARAALPNRSSLAAGAARLHLKLRRATFTRRASDGWRPRPELNRGTRFCRPLRNHSATWPSGAPAWLQPVPRNSPLYRGTALRRQRYG